MTPLFPAVGGSVLSHQTCPLVFPASPPPSQLGSTVSAADMGAALRRSAEFLLVRQVCPEAKLTQEQVTRPRARLGLHEESRRTFMIKEAVGVITAGA